jgi:hypothetical protein
MVIAQAKDADAGSSIAYRIVNGNPLLPNGQNLWQIGQTSGIVTATRPVEYGDTIGDSGEYVSQLSASHLVMYFCVVADFF